MLLDDFLRYFLDLKTEEIMMDLSLVQLAHEARDLLAPVLPYLMPAAAGAGKAALQRPMKQLLSLFLI